MKKINSIIFLCIIFYLIIGFISVNAQEKWKSYTKKNGLVSNKIYVSYVNNNGDIWLGTKSGLNIFDGNNWVSYKKVKNSLTGTDKLFGAIFFIWEDNLKNIWIGSNGGLFKFDGKNWTNYMDKNWRDYIFVKKILEDMNGNIWVCTEYYDYNVGGIFPKIRGGISKFNGKEWISYSEIVGGLHLQKLSESNFYFSSLIEDMHGNIWVGTVDKAYRYNGRDWDSFKEGDIADNYVYFIKEDSRGNIWVGTKKGLSVYFDEQWNTYTKDYGLGGNNVYYFFEDKQNNIWAFTSNYIKFTGLGKFDGEQWTNYTENDGLTSGYIKRIGDFGQGDLWVSSKNGVSKFDGESWTTFTTKDGLGGSNFGQFMQDSKHNIWFTSDNGVTRFDSINWTTYYKTKEPDDN